MLRRILLLILLIPLFLVGCSSSNESSKVTLEFWTTTAEAETTALLDIVEKFEKQHPSIKVDVKEVEFGKAQNQFKTATLSNQAPDILRSDIAWTTEFADLDILLPLDDKVSEKDKEDYFDSAFKYNMYEDHIYGIPMVTDSPALIYNKRMLAEAGFNEAPKTMDELLMMSKALTNENQYGVFISPDSYYALPYVWAFGGGMISDDMEILINNEGSRNGINFMQKLMNEKVVQPELQFDNWNQAMMDDFKTGKVAMIINGPWATTDILGGAEFKNAENLGIAPVPAGPAGQDSPVGGHNLVISKYSQAPDEAYQFIEFLNNRENQAHLAKELGILPTRQSAYEDAELLENQIFQGFKSQLEVATSLPVIPEGPLLLNDFSAYLPKILLKEISTEEGLNRIGDSWEYLIN
ncbi:extracellular solute-binding protein [Enterococcus lemanii]|uniref:Extracellular solute-binding protein n=1 Tax=Enterococcus lemanii TaxID=1159752 RepID=A0ABV9MRN9_9ENTE|nr:extracellular solute-binding protein [Enterococcus lemanii]MBM7710419.1 arabinogalactan oligomer/maltooligosaccharide transport system substrate-binding protein [Enterococcus lemanii]